MIPGMIRATSCRQISAPPRRCATLFCHEDNWRAALPRHRAGICRPDQDHRGHRQTRRRGNGAKATESPPNNPYGLTIGPDGALYVCEVDNHRVVRIDLQERPHHGGGGRRPERLLRRRRTGPGASLNQPYEVLFDRAGNMFFVEMQNHVVRRVDAKTQDHFHRRRDRQAGFQRRRRSRRPRPN